jgi:hypothetical protein
VIAEEGADLADLTGFLDAEDPPLFEEAVLFADAPLFDVVFGRFPDWATLPPTSRRVR